MFMVIVTICAVQFGDLLDCRDTRFHVSMSGSTDECLVVMLKAAIRFHIATPSLQVKNVTCIPTEET